MRIDAWLPSYDIIDTVQREIHARPNEVYRALRELDLGRIFWVRALFRLRVLPSPRNGGFIVLEEKPGEELVVGAVGRFWRLDNPFEQVTPRGFRAFNRPGIARLAWNLRVEPRGRRAQVFSQLRVAFPDEAARRPFGVYWALAGPLSHAIRWGALESVARKLEPRRYVRTQRAHVA
ncbi:MAG: hypothetical protein WBV82_18315 [Myxococcaceae bacterium]